MRFIAADESPPADALVLDNTVDVQQQAEGLLGRAVVVLKFPKWTDGRAYSQAVLLRARMRFDGEIRATGDVLADMLPLLRRCGFDAVQMRADQKLETAQRALGFFDGNYQRVPPERMPLPPAEPPAESRPAP
jgi:uncharacterized protein (DUF934 family)